MLDFFRRTLLHTGRCSHATSSVETAADVHCSESEYSFFNHAATLPFDQINECCCGKARQHEKTRSSRR